MLRHPSCDGTRTSTNVPMSGAVRNAQASPTRLRFTPRAAAIRHALITSYGYGGVNSYLIIGATDRHIGKLAEASGVPVSPSSFGTWSSTITSPMPALKPVSTGAEMKLATKPSRITEASIRIAPVIAARPDVNLDIFGNGGYRSIVDFKKALGPLGDADAVGDHAVPRAGGLEVALRPALERNGGVWFGWVGAGAVGDHGSGDAGRGKLCDGFE